MSTTYRRGRTPSLDLVAGNGLINRRALLGKGIAVAGAMGAAGTVTGAAAEPLKDEQWSLEFGSIMPPVQTASKYEKDVARSLSKENESLRAERECRAIDSPSTVARENLCPLGPGSRW